MRMNYPSGIRQPITSIANVIRRSVQPEASKNLIAYRHRSGDGIRAWMQPDLVPETRNVREELSLKFNSAVTRVPTE